MTYDEFVRRLSASLLMTPQALRTHLHEVPSAQRPRDARALAKWLVKTGHLTPWQAKAVYSGRTGGLVLGNYVLLDKLGAGGMGEVYKARHQRMHRTVALKVLSEAVAHDESLIARFQREVQAAAKLMHPNIVTAFDADEADGRFFLVMEYVPGRDLASIVRQRGPLPLEQALDAVLDAARGLEYAHRHGIIHRDIKPANLLLMDAEHQRGPHAEALTTADHRSTVKILDMGLARIDETSGDLGEQVELTGTGVVMGTVDYMAPEQALNTRSADHRSDIYSLGITLYYLLTGQPAYSGSSVMERLVNHREAPIPSLRARRSSISAQLDQVFARMVAKRPDERFQSMGEVIAALRSVRSGGKDARSGGATIVASTESSDTALASFLHSMEAGGASGPVSATQPTRVLNVSDAEVADTLIGRSEDATQTLMSAGVPPRTRRRSATPPRWLWSSVILGGVLVLGVVVMIALNESEPNHDAVITDASPRSSGSNQQEGDEASASSAPFETPPTFHRLTDREVAQHIVDLGGSFDYRDFFGESQSQVRELPELEEFAVTGVRLLGGDIVPEDLLPLLSLQRLTHLQFAPAQLTIEHLETIGRLTTLQGVDLATGTPTDVDDGDVARLLARLPDLQSFFSRNLPLDGSCLLSAPRALRHVALQSDPNRSVPSPPRLAPAAFTAMQRLQDLWILDLDHRTLDAEQFAGITSLSSVERLRLAGCDGIPANLPLLQKLPELDHLILERTALEDKHLPDLLEFTQLVHLDVRVNYLTAEAVERLRQALPNCTIESDFGRFEPGDAEGGAAMDAGDLSPVDELNAPGREDGYCWPSADGQVLLYVTQREGEHQVRQAVRDSQGLFRDQMYVISERVLAAFSGDLLHVVAARNVDGVRVLVEGSRESLDQQFHEYTAVRTNAEELQGTSPWLSGDGLTLVYQNNNPPRDYAGGLQTEAGGMTTEFLITRRAAVGQPWDSPQQLPLEDSPLLTEALTWPMLTDDGTTLLFCDSGTWRARVMVATRSSLDQPFGDVRPLLIHGEPIDARAPRYVPATGELYLTRRDEAEDWNLWRLRSGRIVNGEWVPGSDPRR